MRWTCQQLVDSHDCPAVSWCAARVASVAGGGYARGIGGGDRIVCARYTTLSVSQGHDGSHPVTQSTLIESRAWPCNTRVRRSLCARSVNVHRQCPGISSPVVVGVLRGSRLYCAHSFMGKETSKSERQRKCLKLSVFLCRDFVCTGWVLGRAANAASTPGRRRAAWS
jgi:hypothetical protein